MYNVKLISGNDNSGDKGDRFDYSRTVNSIKAWNAESKKWL
ncbi:MAG TPA: hypothetical protein VMZ91_12840 [Candidatus Paceibacterota bacterium]|nr:hypothetical protein [Candidatus Paceibacterota bacterium]